ncbi:MFS transporter [Bartonella sp. LJL80]
MTVQNQNQLTKDRRGQWIAGLVAAAFFMENLDATVITTALPQMGLTFQTDPVNINIGISAYMLTLGVFIPASGWLTDRYGSRRMFSLAVLIFTFASLLCGLSTNLSMFVGCRVLQGVGGAMMVPVGRLVVLRQTPKERLVQAIALLTWPGLVAPVLGPPIGGVIAQYTHWSLIFYLNIPIGLAILVLSLKLFPDERVREPKAFDLSGFLLTGLGLALLLFAAEEIGGKNGITIQVISCFCAGSVILALSVLHLQRAKAPLVALDALRYRTFAVSVYGGTIFRMTANAVVFILPLMAQLAMGYTPTQAGLLLMPIFIGNLAIKPFTTPLMRYFGFRNTLICNCILNALFLASYGLFSAQSPLWLMIVVLTLSGVFRSIQFTALNTIAFADVPSDRMNGANTLFSTVFQLGIGLGIALGAISLRAGSAITGLPLEASVAPFQLALYLVAILSIFPLWGILRLEHGAGDLVAGRANR